MNLDIRGRLQATLERVASVSAKIAAPEIISGCLSIAIGVQLLSLVSHLMPGRTEQTISRKPVRESVSGKALPAYDVSKIVAAHLFGTVTSTSSPAPESKLPLVLAGTIATSNPDRGYAIIGETALAARTYAVGAEIPGGATLHRVFSDRVILSRFDTFETLSLPRDSRTTRIEGSRSIQAAGDDLEAPAQVRPVPGVRPHIIPAGVIRADAVLPRE